MTKSKTSVQWKFHSRSKLDRNPGQQVKPKNANYELAVVQAIGKLQLLCAAETGEDPGFGATVKTLLLQLPLGRHMYQEAMLEIGQQEASASPSS